MSDVEPSAGVKDETVAEPCRVMRVKFRRTAHLTPLTNQVRRSMAVLWNDMVKLHKRIRRGHWKWPSQAAFDAHFLKRKGRYPGLPSACIQQAVRKFFGNLKTTRKNRTNGLTKARYPWRDQKHFATVPYRGDLVRWENGHLTLGGGNGGEAIVLPMHENPGRILKAELLFDEILVTVQACLEAPRAELIPSRPPKVAAGDPGQRWAWAILTEDGQSLMVNGRAVVSEKIRRAKKMGHLQAALSGKQQGSKRYRKIRRHMARLKAKSARRLRDMNHKISCGVVRECEQAKVTHLVLSQPQGIAEAPGRKAQRQRNGLWEYGEQSRQIEYKARGHFEVSRAGERGTSSTCPHCHRHSKPSGRIFRCPHCGWTAHRDLVGSGNQLGRHATHVDVAALIEHTHPKYLRAFATANARSRVVETDRSRVLAARASRPGRTRDRESGPLENTLEGQHRLIKAGAARPVPQPPVSRGKNLGAPSVLDGPRTPPFCPCPRGTCRQGTYR